MYEKYGDYAVATLMAEAWTDAAVLDGRLDRAASPGRRAAECVAGAWAGDLVNGNRATTSTLSPGDLDEAVSALLAFRGRSTPGNNAFVRFRAFRRGFVDGAAGVRSADGEARLRIVTRRVTIVAVSVAFLVLSVISAVLTLNALVPRSRRSVLAVPSFFAAWPLSDLAPQVLAVEVVVVAVLVWAGALESTAGVVALCVSVLSWAGMVELVRRASGSAPIVEQALADGLGDAATLGAAVDDATANRTLSVIRLALAVPIAGRGVAIERDVRYAEGDGRRHLLDVYHPVEGVAAAPVLLQIHGGAWIVGDKRQQARPLMHHLASHGWVCVAPNYRRSPAATFPDHLVDVKRALQWVRQRAADYGGDPGFVAITGGSAGAHLAALAALTPDEPEYQPGFEEVDTSVSACVVFYGAYDLTGRFGGVGADGMGGLIERAVLKRRLADDPIAFSRASPLDRIRRDAPPFMIVHGTDDSLVPIEEARAFAARMRELSSSPTVYLELPHAQHAFEIFDSVRSETVVRGVHRFLAFVRNSGGGLDDASRRPGGHLRGSGRAESRGCSD